MHTSFLNCRLCINGELVERRFVVEQDSGLILQETGFIGGDAVDLEEGIIAPGFLELHTNGINGFHFSGYAEGNELSVEQYDQRMADTAKFYASKGITGFWATLPTVETDVYKKVLPRLSPKEFDRSAALLGAHVEGPYLTESKKGAHNSSLFREASKHSLASTYGDLSNIKWTTLAPEHPGSDVLIKECVQNDIRVSLGHSNGTFDDGLKALDNGATALTHTLNGMSALHHRDPGLAGLITLPESDESSTRSSSTTQQPPYYAILADGNHLHPNVATMLYRAAPHRAMIISDSIELAGLEDGPHPGHAQIPFTQIKKGTAGYIEGTSTLIGSCVSVEQCVKNLMKWSGCGVAAAVQTVTENVAKFMGIEDRGFLEEGARADFVILSDEGDVLETWVAGYKVWSKAEGYVQEE